MVRAVPGSAPIAAAPTRVTTPDQVLLAPARFCRAPLPLMPVPLRMIGSVTLRPEPSTCTAAPLATTVAPAVPPRAALPWTCTTPWLTKVTPVYVLALLDRVRVPAPVLVRLPLPPMAPF